jgi:hypothetical protein
MSKRIDHTGQRFGRWTVLAFAKSDARGQAHWLCKCDCGEQKVVRGADLRNGSTFSCGCFKTAASILRNIRHGHARHGSISPEYRSWYALRGRCTNPKNTRYGDWGGRGIRVCDRWRSFDNFLADMGRKPSPEYSIERRDNDGHYEPSNCYWATRKEQRANQRPARKAA